MKATGIVRRIDDLGRVVIPKEIRKTLHIRDGDPLEIYTDNEGAVIFKKYSPMGELRAFASNMCEVMSRTCGVKAAICDRDDFIALSGIAKSDLMDKHISRELETLMEQRKSFSPADGNMIPLTDEGKHLVGTAAPIISDGDVLGCVVIIREDEKALGEAEMKLTKIAADFLGKQMEN